jgi:hypothetical protein
MMKKGRGKRKERMMRDTVWFVWMMVDTVCGSVKGLTGKTYGWGDRGLREGGEDTVQDMERRLEG